MYSLTRSCQMVQVRSVFFLLSFFFFNVLSLFEAEREHEQGRGRERDTHRIRSRLQALRVSTEPDAGLELMTCEIVT